MNVIILWRLLSQLWCWPNCGITFIYCTCTYKKIHCKLSFQLLYTFCIVWAWESMLKFDWFYSLEREEAEDLIKCHGGRVTGSISKKTVFSLLFSCMCLDWYDYQHVINIFCLQNYLLCDEDIGGRKSSKAKELGFVIWDPYMQFFLSSFLCYILTPLTSYLYIVLPFSLRMDCLIWSVRQILQKHLYKKNLRGQ